MKAFSLALRASSLFLLLSFSAPAAFAVEAPLQPEAINTLLSWQRTAKTDLAADQHSYFSALRTASKFYLQHQKESEFTEDEKRLAKIFTKDVGWMTCITGCVIHVRSSHLSEFIQLIDSTVKQNERDQVTYAKFLQDEAARARQAQIDEVKQREHDAKNRVAEAKRQAELEKQHELQAKEDQKAENALIEKNKNHRLQLPTILGDWYFPGSGSTEADLVHYEKGPGSTIKEYTCQADVYWTSGRKLCITKSDSSDNTIKPTKFISFKFDPKLNGFCPTDDDNCAYMIQVSNDNARSLVVVKSPYDHLKETETDKTYSTYSRIDAKLPTPGADNKVVAGALTTMTVQLASAVGNWTTIKDKSDKSEDSSESADTTFLRIENAATGKIFVGECDVDVWKSTNHRKCDSSGWTLYYFHPVFGGFCSEKSCQDGYKFEGGRLYAITDPLGSNGDSNKGTYSAKYKKYLK